jgi:thymidylate synthase (FAD)
MRVKLLYHTDLDSVKRALEERRFAFDPEILLDHVVYSFEIEDVSRVTTHQLVRHRMASYDQESQRFSAATREGAVTPPNIQTNKAAMEAYESGLKSVYEAYEKIVAAGVPKEDARYILPNAIKTKVLMTLSAKALMHLVWQRTAMQAQWEIRELAGELLRNAKEATPELWNKIIER